MKLARLSSVVLTCVCIQLGSGAAPFEVESQIHTINRGSAEHYNWGTACDGWHYLKRDDISVIRERVPSGEKEVMHYHEHARQFFYILKGRATMVMDSDSVELKEGDGLEIPPGTWHQFSNDSGQNVEIMVVSMPKSHGDKIVRESE